MQYAAIAIAGINGLHNYFGELSCRRRCKIRSHMSTWDQAELLADSLANLIAKHSTGRHESDARTRSDRLLALRSISARRISPLEHAVSTREHG